MNPIKYEGVKIKLDKERHLKFDFNTLIDLEEEYGSLEKFQDVLLNTPSMKDIRKILYHALKHEDETLTELKVGRLIILTNLDEITNSFMGAYNNSFPELSEEEIEKAKN